MLSSCVCARFIDEKNSIPAHDVRPVCTNNPYRLGSPPPPAFTMATHKPSNTTTTTTTTTTTNTHNTTTIDSAGARAQQQPYCEQNMLCTMPCSHTRAHTLQHGTLSIDTTRPQTALLRETRLCVYLYMGICVRLNVSTTTAHSRQEQEKQVFRSAPHNMYIVIV